MKVTEITTGPAATVSNTKAAGGPNTEQQKLKNACQDFEAVLLSSLMKGLRSTVPKSDLFGSSREGEMFQEMMDQEICKSMARTQSTGLADMLYRQLSKDLHSEH